MDDTKSEEEGRITTSATERRTAQYNNNSVKKARLESTLVALLSDPVLADVPTKPSLSDVDTLINLELGSAMHLTVLKLHAISFAQKFCGLDFCLLFMDGKDVAMMTTMTIKDLKLAIKKKFNDMEESAMGHHHISLYVMASETPFRCNSFLMLFQKLLEGTQGAGSARLSWSQHKILMQKCWS